MIDEKEETTNISLSRDEAEYVKSTNSEVQSTIKTSSVTIEEEPLEDVKPTETATIVSKEEKKSKRNLILTVIFIVVDVVLLAAIIWQIVSIFINAGSN